MNTQAFLADQHRYFHGAHEQFLAFGGPCVYFHQQCLDAGETSFLSDRHIEMLYATLTAWGMHRMGDVKTTRAKLTKWSIFRDSILRSAALLEPVKRLDLLELAEPDYSEVLSQLGPVYRNLRLSESEATIVANSKALFHVLPRLIPPIDRQYTIRFFQYPPEKWRNTNGQFRPIMLPAAQDAQFALFRSTCLKIRNLAHRVEQRLLAREFVEHHVTAPKAIDNAIVHFVRVNSGASGDGLALPV